MPVFVWIILGVADWGIHLACGKEEEANYGDRIKPTGFIIMIGVAVVGVVAIAAFIYYLRKRRTERLRSQFGAAEYARTVLRAADILPIPNLTHKHGMRKV